MAVGDSNYQGGGATILTGFYNNLRQDEFRRQQQEALEGQARAKARDQTAKDLGGVVSKLTSKGLRNQAEIDIYAKLYGEVKDYSALASSAETVAERAKYTTLTIETAKKAMEFVDGAEEFKKPELAMANKFQAYPFSYGEDQKTKYKNDLNIPYTQLGGRFDPTPYATRLTSEDVEKRVSGKIKGLLEAQGTLLARTEAFTSGNNVGNMIYQDVTLAPELATKEVIKLINTDIGVQEHYNRLYPSLKTEELAVNIVKDYENSLIRKDLTGTFEKNKDPKSGGSPSDAKSAATLAQRIATVNSFVDNKDQTTFEGVKASLPFGSTLGWKFSVGTAQKMKAEGRKFPKPEEITGVRVTVPSFFDKESNRYDKIDEIIDFRQGDPKKKLNTLINTYYGKNIENEDLGNTKKATTTPKPKASTGGSTPMKTTKKSR
jgi:hypothetical protein